MKKLRAVWIFAALTPILLVLGPVTFFVSTDIGRIKGEPDGVIPIIGFLAALGIMALGVVCGIYTADRWWNRRE